jgi:hypothetical protein
VPDTEEHRSRGRGTGEPFEMEFPLRSADGVFQYHERIRGIF